MIVYLAGYMSADVRTRQWRNRATECLRPYGIETLDPFRGKQEMSKDGLKCGNSASILTARDKMDIENSDVILLNTLGMEDLERQSIGTWSEFGFGAIGLQRPTVVIADHPSIMEHPFIQSFAAEVVPTLAAGIDAILWLDSSQQ